MDTLPADSSIDLLRIQITPPRTKLELAAQDNQLLGAGRRSLEVAGIPICPHFKGNTPSLRQFLPD
jgi:hypothetical protein